MNSINAEKELIGQYSILIYRTDKKKYVRLDQPILHKDLESVKRRLETRDGFLLADYDIAKTRIQKVVGISERGALIFKEAKEEWMQQKGE